MLIRDDCIQTYRAAVEEFAHLEVVTPESQSTLSGAAGFAVAPIAYKLGKKGFLLDENTTKSDSSGKLVQLWGDAKKRAENGRIRIVVTDSTNSIYSEPSAPITFSMPDGVYSNVELALCQRLLPSYSCPHSPLPSPSPSPSPVDPEAGVNPASPLPSPSSSPSPVDPQRLARIQLRPCPRPLQRPA